MSKTNADRKYCNTYFFKELDKIFKANGNPKWTSNDARARLGVDVHISSISNWISCKFLPSDAVISKFANVIGKDFNYVKGKMIQDYVRINGVLPMHCGFKMAGEIVDCANNSYIEDGSTDRVMIDDSDMYKKLYGGRNVSVGKIEAVIVEGAKQRDPKDGMSLQEFFEQETKKLAENIQNAADDVVPVKEAVKGTIFEREESSPADNLLGFNKRIAQKRVGEAVRNLSDDTTDYKAIVTRRRNKALRILDNISRNEFDNNKLMDECSTAEEIISYLGNRIVEQSSKIRRLEESYGTTAYYNGVVYGTQVCTDNGGNLIHRDAYDKYISELCENIEITDLTKLLYGKLSYEEFKIFDDLYSHADGRNDDFLINLINTVIVNVANEIRETDEER